MGRYWQVLWRTYDEEFKFERTLPLPVHLLIEILVYLRPELIEVGIGGGAVIIPNVPDISVIRNILLGGALEMNGKADLLYSD